MLVRFGQINSDSSFHLEGIHIHVFMTSSYRSQSPMDVMFSKCEVAGSVTLTEEEREKQKTNTHVYCSNKKFVWTCQVTKKSMRKCCYFLNIITANQICRGKMCLSFLLSLMSPVFYCEFLEYMSAQISFVYQGPKISLE